jgi:hypothetical protein
LLGVKLFYSFVRYLAKIQLMKASVLMFTAAPNSEGKQTFPCHWSVPALPHLAVALLRYGLASLPACRACVPLQTPPRKLGQQRRDLKYPSCPLDVLLFSFSYLMGKNPGKYKKKDSSFFTTQFLFSFLLIVTLAAIARFWPRLTLLSHHLPLSRQLSTSIKMSNHSKELEVAELAVQRATVLTKKVFHEKAKGTLSKDDKSPSYQEKLPR